jgi:hypothetical protein
MESLSAKIGEHGEVAEWLKAHAWKACIGVTQSQVRILFSPPRYNYSNQQFVYD